jgi:PAS domain S-box-containing protein
VVTRDLVVDDGLGTDQRWFAVHVVPHLGPDGDVVERQLPFFFLFVVALGFLTLPQVDANHPAAVVWASVIAGGTVVAARLLPWGRWPDAAQDALPVLQLVAVGLLRAGTGGTGSTFTSILFLPVIALASRQGRRGVVIVAVGAAAVILAPVLIDRDTTLTLAVVLRSVFLSLVSVVVAITVHAITENLRMHAATLAALRENERVMVGRMRDDALELARVAANRKVVRDQLLSVIDSATEQAIVATDRDGLVEVFNAGAERMLGYAQGEVVGRMNVKDFALPEEVEARTSGGRAPRLEDFLEQISARRGALRDWTVVRRDGTRLTARLAVTQRTDIDGSVSGYVVVATDVTAEREAERLKDEFVSLVSHELRTPLTSVLGYLELLQDGTDPLSDEQREYLAIIERNARRQLRLVGDLLLTAQVEAGTFAISPAPIDLADVARAAALAAGPNAEQAGVALVLDARPAPVVGDAGRLGQAVDNLVSNALKFTERGGTVHLRVAPRPDGGAHVAVADTGIGIPPDELAQLTDRFFRATTATRRAIPGVGLGLSITKAVVDAHGGELRIASAVGEGTTFTLELPPAPPG